MAVALCRSVQSPPAEACRAAEGQPWIASTQCHLRTGYADRSEVLLLMPATRQRVSLGLRAYRAEIDFYERAKFVPVSNIIVGRGLIHGPC